MSDAGGAARTAGREGCRFTSQLDRNHGRTHTHRQDIIYMSILCDDFTVIASIVVCLFISFLVLLQELGHPRLLSPLSLLSLAHIH